MVTFCIFGSYAIRTCFEFINSKMCSVSLYVPSVSLGTFSNQAVSSKYNISGLNDFAKSMCIRELESTFFEELLKSKSKYILIDLSEEHYDYIVTKNNLILTKNSSINKMFSVKNEKMECLPQIERVIKSYTKEWFDLWDAGCKKFIDQLCENEVNPIIVKNYHPMNCSKEISKNELENINSINEKIDMLYNKFISYLSQKRTEQNIILLENKKIISDASRIGKYHYGFLTEMTKCYIAKSILEKISLPSAYKEPLIEVVERIYPDMSKMLSLNSIPSISELHELGRRYLENGNDEKALFVENLIYFLHNSSVPNTVTIEKGVSFGYGGIGVVVHADSKIGEYSKIGQNVTIGLGAIIGRRCVINPGCKIVKKIRVGDHCIIGANAVVNQDIPSLTVWAGVPARLIAHITEDNIDKYAKYIYKGTSIEYVKNVLFNCEELE